MGAISTKFYTYQFLTIGFCHHNTMFLDAPEFSPVMCRQKTGSEAGSSATKSGLPMHKPRESTDICSKNIIMNYVTSLSYVNKQLEIKWFNGKYSDMISCLFCLAFSENKKSVTKKLEFLSMYHHFLDKFADELHSN